MTKEAPASRDAVRSAFFSAENKKRKCVVVDFFGQKVEVRQPTLKQIQDVARTGDQDSSLVRALCEYCYIPETDEKMFDMADTEQILSMPAGRWLSNFNEALDQLTELDVGEKVKN